MTTVLPPDLPDTQGRRIPRGFLAWFAVLFIVTQAPLYLARYPDVVDYPNHVARLHVLTHLDTSEVLQRFYRLEPGVAPNMAMDLLAPLLTNVASLETAVKLFASIATLLTATGALALGIALHGRLTSLALGGLLFAHNAFFQLGLFNYVFGVGAGLWLLAAWIAARRRTGTTYPGTWLGFAAGATLIYLCHLSALGVYLLGVLAFEWGRSGRHMPERALQAVLPAACQALPALLLQLLAYRPGTNLASAFPATDLASLVAYKVSLALLLPRVAFHSHPILAAAVAAPAAFLLYRALRLRRVAWSKPGGRIVAAIAVAMLLLPAAGLGSNMVDMRLALPLALVSLASLGPADTGGRGSTVTAPLIAAGVLLLAGGTLHGWWDASRAHQALRQAMLAIEPGSRVAVVALEEASPGSAMSAASGITPHAAAWSVPDRSVLLSSFFIRPFQPFTVAFRPEFVPVARLARLDNDAPSPTLSALRGHFGYVVAFGAPQAREQFAGESLALYRSDYVTILRP